MSDSEGPRRLDPQRAAEEARGEPGPGPVDGPARRLPDQPIDTRRYQWMIGGFGLLLLIIFSVYLLTGQKGNTPGVPAGRSIHRFVAPLATSNLNVPANAHPRCNRSRPARRGLNVCGRGTLVLAFFVTGYSQCVDEVDTLQALSHRFRGVQFAAVAVNAGRAATARLVRRHHWSIPVAYDLTGTIGQLYGVVVCPIIELIRPGGVVEQRLIGERWRSPAALAPRVTHLARVAGSAPPAGA
ncbi:MAG TPA: TlpA disulfide reductase family protein [Solirubrobacteraceae bacterium]|nr:TlpA disulfide reductase family protein [Solirubrobacteraceae bacterium]